MRRAARRIALVLAVVCGGMALWSAAAGGQAGGSGSPLPRRASALADRGRALYAQACVRCHGEDLRGVPGQGPSLIGAGAAAVDFYVSTGRMPLANPTDEPVRNDPLYPRRDIDALVAYVGAFGNPRLPNAYPDRGSVARGKEAFTERCAGCHQVVGRGGIVTGAFVPAVTEVSPRQLAEALRVGPYLMPVFGAREAPQSTVDDLAAYVRFTADPDDRGGWGIGNLGPVAEGLVAWALAGAVLLGVVRLLGERAE